MTGTSVLREALRFVSFWKEHVIIVHVELDKFTQRHCILSLASDIALLKQSGINVVLLCNSKESDSLIRYIQRSYTEVQLIDSIEEVKQIARQYCVVKVCFLCSCDGLFNQKGLIHELTVDACVQALDSDYISGVMRKKTEIAVELCNQGVQRVHFINIKREGSLLEEFLTSKGKGTMIYNASYKEVRKAEYKDVTSIVSIIRSVDPTISEEMIMQYMDDIKVFSVDDIVHAVMITACCQDDYIVECLTHSGEFRESESLNILLEKVEEEAKDCAKDVLIDPSKVPELIGIQPWFTRRGYVRHREKGPHYKWWKKTMSN